MSVTKINVRATLNLDFITGSPALAGARAGALQEKLKEALQETMDKFRQETAAVALQSLDQSIIVETTPAASWRPLQLNHRLLTMSEGSRYLRDDMIGRLINGPATGGGATSLEDAELERVFKDCAAPAFCMEHTRRCRDLGLTLDEVHELSTLQRHYLQVEVGVEEAAFEENPLRELGMILTQAAQDALDTHQVTEQADMYMRDTNGNRVGTVSIVDKMREPHPSTSAQRAQRIRYCMPLPSQEYAHIQADNHAEFQCALRQAAHDALRAAGAALLDGKTDVPGFAPGTLEQLRDRPKAKTQDAGQEITP